MALVRERGEREMAEDGLVLAEEEARTERQDKEEAQAALATSERQNGDLKRRVEEMEEVCACLVTPNPTHHRATTASRLRRPCIIHHERPIQHTRNEKQRGVERAM